METIRELLDFRFLENTGEQWLLAAGIAVIFYVVFFIIKPVVRARLSRALGGAKVRLATCRASPLDGRLLVIGFASGPIPSIPLNLTLLKGCAPAGAVPPQPAGVTSRAAPTAAAVALQC